VRPTTIRTRHHQSRRRATLGRSVVIPQSLDAVQISSASSRTCSWLSRPTARAPQLASGWPQRQARFRSCRLLAIVDQPSPCLITVLRRDECWPFFRRPIIGGQWVPRLHLKQMSWLHDIGDSASTALSGVTFSTTMNSADVHAKEWDEEQHAEQHPPEHSPGRSGPHRVMVGDHPELALPVPDDRRDGVGLDDQLLLQALGLVHRGQRRGLVRVPDRDQFRHLCLLARQDLRPRGSGSAMATHQRHRGGSLGVRPQDACHPRTAARCRPCLTRSGRCRMRCRAGVPVASGPSGLHQCVGFAAARRHESGPRRCGAWVGWGRHWPPWP
jgi:hypothetical protein